jgi:hypothetical protein
MSQTQATTITIEAEAAKHVQAGKKDQIELFISSHHQATSGPATVLVVIAHAKSMVRADHTQRHLRVIVLRVGRQLCLNLLTLKTAFGTHCEKAE